MKSRLMLKTSAVVLGLGVMLVLPAVNRLRAADSDAATKTVKGEIVDLMCYLDHGAKGEKHQGCAGKCIKSGGPVGLLSGEDLYLVVGDHKPMNDQLVDKAAKEVTLKGKVVERNGMKMIENAVLVE